VVVRGAEAVQPATMGTFTRLVDVVHGNRSLYRKGGGGRTGGGSTYLFYWAPSSAWIIGPSYESARAGVVSTSRNGNLTRCPYDAFSWQVATSSGWTTAYPVTVARKGWSALRASDSAARPSAAESGAAAGSLPEYALLPAVLLLIVLVWHGSRKMGRRSARSCDDEHVFLL
jgi:hypothetical protein